MNLLGKILVILIFVMSVLFMAFSVMVYMTHNNWKQMAATSATEVRDAQTKNQELQAQIQSIQTQYASERAARTTAVATLEARARTSEQQLAVARQELLALNSDKRQAQAQIAGSIKTLEDVKSKVEALRETVKKAEEDRDRMFQEVVSLKGQVLELEATRDRLAARNEEIVSRFGAATAVLRAHDLSENSDITNVPPPRDGEIKHVDSDNKYVLLSLGSDDGIRRGHTLDVFRGNKYLGRVQITKTYTDRAVARVLDDFRKAAIRVGDGVRTKIG